MTSATTPVLRSRLGAILRLAFVVSALALLPGTPAGADHHENACNPCAGKAANPCNPCEGKAANPCNPCAGKEANPCNPCGAKNPCNPCGASLAPAGDEQLAATPVPAVKRAHPIVLAGKSSCAEKAAAEKAKGDPAYRVAHHEVPNACNPCAGANPCNPCGGDNPCNPCGGNPCNPCGGNPCNPCGTSG